jgi:SPP1 gp7 family putative phage head morphogenesis protein
LTKKQKFDQLFRRSIQKENNLIRLLKKQYAIAYDESLAEIREYHSKFSEKGQFSYEEMVKYNRLKALNNSIAKNIENLYKGVKKEIDATMYKNFIDAYTYTGFILETEAQARLNFMVLPKEQIIASVQNPLTGLALDETIDKNAFLIKSRVRQSLTQSIIQGRTISDTAKRIQNDMDIGFNTAVKIARTEITRTRNEGQEQAYEHAKDLGIEFNKIWVATLDDRTREDHQELDGQVADAEGFFHVAGEKALYPAGFGVASLDINCRCTTIVDIDMPTERREGITKQIIPYQTYEEWEENRLREG